MTEVVLSFAVCLYITYNLMEGGGIELSDMVSLSQMSHICAFGL